MDNELKNKIQSYYKRCIQNNKRWWDLEQSHAIHAGYVDETTHTLHEALVRENEVMAAMANINEGDYVLDAGCGVGGSAIFLAVKYKCKVVGIDVCEDSIQAAREYAKEDHAGVQVE